MSDALSIYEEKYGSEDEKVLEMRDELARLYIRTDRLEVTIVIFMFKIEMKEPPH